MAKMKSLLIGYKSKWTLALFILLIFIELVSVHKSAKKEKKEKEPGQHPALGQWMRIECTCRLCIGVLEMQEKKHHIYHTAHLCTLLNFHWKKPNWRQKNAEEISITSARVKIKRKKKFSSSPAGNRTPVSRVTGGDTHHYTTEDPAYQIWKI